MSLIDCCQKQQDQLKLFFSVMPTGSSSQNKHGDRLSVKKYQLFYIKTFFKTRNSVHKRILITEYTTNNIQCLLRGFMQYY